MQINIPDRIITITKCQFLIQAIFIMVAMPLVLEVADRIIDAKQLAELNNKRLNPQILEPWNLDYSRFQSDGTFMVTYKQYYYGLLGGLGTGLVCSLLTAAIIYKLGNISFIKTAFACMVPSLIWVFINSGKIDLNILPAIILGGVLNAVVLLFLYRRTERQTKC